MVGTPQLPLKYRRKGVADFRVYTPDPDMQFHTSTSSFDSYRFGLEYSIPHSPTPYSSSSSIAPSSPVRSVHTPEPSSSPLAEPYITSSPKSPRPTTRKGFWEVAFNYGPDFPYKPRPAAQSSDFGREQFLTRRRSSSASAPPLVSDIEPSDYSEDNDPFHMDDDATDEENVSGSVTIVNSRDELALNGPRASDLHQDGVDARIAGGKMFAGEMDVAAVLLDLSRQVRFGSVDSRPDDIAIKPTTLLPSDLARKDIPTSLPVVCSEAVSCVVEETSIITHVVPADEDISVSCDNGQEIKLSNLDERDIPGHGTILEADGTRHAASTGATDVPFNAVEDEVCSNAEPESSTSLRGAYTGVDSPSDDIAVANVEDTSISNGQADITSTPEICTIANVQREDLDPIVESIFCSVLTPISSPALSGSELTDITEPLSGLSSPVLNALELTGPSIDTRQLRESEDRNMVSRPSSPVPGPSNDRFGSADQCEGSTKSKCDHSQKGLKKGKPRTVFDVKTNEAEEQQPDRKGKKKRARSISATESRSSSPTPSASCSDIPRPRKKRSKKAGEVGSTSRDENSALSMNSAHLPSSSPSNTGSSHTLPVHGSSPASQVPKLDDEPTAALVENDADEDAKAEMCGCLIQAMALSRASSMPASSLLRDVLRENPHLANQRSKTDWIGIVQFVLESHDVFGRVDRQGLDADDKPLEAQWFYVPENDPDQERASLLREMMPKKRSETKRHKQYFFKPLGKISRWDSEDAP